MVRVEQSILIDAAPASVFDYVSDPANLPSWQAVVIETRTAGAAEPGSRFIEVRSFLGRQVETTMEVTELAKDERFCLRAVTGPWPFEVQHLFVREGSATRLEVVFQGQATGPVRIARVVVQRTVTSELERDLQVLKRVLESGW